MRLGSEAKPVNVLLVEDNPGDAALTQEALKKSQYRTNLAVVEDGEIAMAYLRKEGDHAGSPRPDLILLDLSLPKKDGPEVLADLQADEDLVNIPVVILTGSEAERSLLESYNIPANRYMSKPMILSRFDNVIRIMTTAGGLTGRMPVPKSDPLQIRKMSEKKSGGRSWWPFGKR